MHENIQSKKNQWREYMYMHLYIRVSCSTFTFLNILTSKVEAKGGGGPDSRASSFIIMNLPGCQAGIPPLSTSAFDV